MKLDLKTLKDTAKTEAFDKNGEFKSDVRYIPISPFVLLDLIERLEGMEATLVDFKLNHEHAPNLPHTRAYGDTYGWCDFCSTKVSWGPGEAEYALEKWGTK